MTTFYVPLEKRYYRKRRPEDTMTLTGYIPVEAKTQQEAVDTVSTMLNRNGECLQTCDPRIRWEEKRPSEAWEYEDFTFGFPEDQYDYDTEQMNEGVDLTVKPEGRTYKH